MKKVIVVGSGAGGAAAALMLQGKFAVTVLEAGREFKPFSFNLPALEKLKKTGLFFDERAIRLLFSSMRVHKTEDGMIMVRGTCLGGTTTLSCGNALRMDNCLQELGIDLGDEFEELYREIPVTMTIGINGAIPLRGCSKYAKVWAWTPGRYRSLGSMNVVPTAADASWAAGTGRNGTAVECLRPRMMQERKLLQGVRL